jgi:hypothetical protein
MDILYLPGSRIAGMTSSAYSALTGEFIAFGDSVGDGNHCEWDTNDDDEKH